MKTRRISINDAQKEPVAFITVKKQRVKQHNDTVYLKGGTHFEIELYNPTSTKYLAKIKLNNNDIGNAGIVLRPGERVFLDRYLDEPKKFLFDTYMVEDSGETRQAIRNNGDLMVKFYKEYIQQPSTITFTSNSDIYNPFNPTFTTNNIGIGGSSPTYSSNINTEVTLDMMNNTNSISNILRKSVETGRVEKGEKSDQEFLIDNSTFEYYSSATSSWKILPISQKPVVKEDIKVYCTECGSRKRKDSFKFCPQCGTKFE